MVEAMLREPTAIVVAGAEEQHRLLPILRHPSSPSTFGLPNRDVPEDSTRPPVVSCNRPATRLGSSWGVENLNSSLRFDLSRNYTGVSSLWHDACITRSRRIKHRKWRQDRDKRFPRRWPHDWKPGPLPHFSLPPRPPSPNPRTATCFPRQVALFFSPCGSEQIPPWPGLATRTRCYGVVGVRRAAIMVISTRTPGDKPTCTHARCGQWSGPIHSFHTSSISAFWVMSAR